jgi:2-haloacid dehalogenase
LADRLSAQYLWRGTFRAYQALVAEAAAEAGLPRRLAADLAAGFAALQPWPEAPGVLNALSSVLPIGVVTNCSEGLAQIAAGRTGADFAIIVSAERAGFYKPHPRPYQIALDALGTAPERCLFVTGSPYGLFCTGRLGLPATGTIGWGWPLCPTPRRGYGGKTH